MACSVGGGETTEKKEMVDVEREAGNTFTQMTNTKPMQENANTSGWIKREESL